MSVRALRFWEPQLDIRMIRGLNEQAIPDLRDRVVSFKLEDDAKKLDTAELTLDNGDGKLLDPTSLAFGVIFSISFGYNGALSPPRLYEVRKISGALRIGGLGAIKGPHTQAGGLVQFKMVSTLWDMNLLRGVSKAGRADRQTSFNNTTVADVVVRLAARYGYIGTSAIIDTMENEEVLEEVVIPASMSDAEWIQDKARERGWTFAVDADGFRFHGPSRQSRPIDIEELTWFAGDPDVISFEVDGDLNLPGTLGVAGVRTERRHGAAQNMASGTGDSSAEENSTSAPELNMSEVGHSSVPVTLETQRRTNPLLLESFLTVPGPNERMQVRRERAVNKSMDRWTLKLKLVGNPNVRARRNLQLVNFGPMLDGQWWVRKAVHSYQANQVYITEIEAKRKGPGLGVGDIRRAIGGVQNPEGSVAAASEFSTSTYNSLRTRQVNMDRYRPGSVTRETSE